MVKQAITVSVIPDDSNPIRYALWISSQGWKDGTPVTCYQHMIGEFDGLPNEVAPDRFEEWTDGMLGLIKAQVRTWLAKQDAASISGAGAPMLRAKETPSQDV